MTNQMTQGVLRFSRNSEAKAVSGFSGFGNSPPALPPKFQSFPQNKPWSCLKDLFFVFWLFLFLNKLLWPLDLSKLFSYLTKLILKDGKVLQRLPTWLLICHLSLHYILLKTMEGRRTLTGMTMDECGYCHIGEGKEQRNF